MLVRSRREIISLVLQTPSKIPDQGRSMRQAPAAGRVVKKAGFTEVAGALKSYCCDQRVRKSGCWRRSTSAQTLPPKPAPKADAAMAPSSRALVARKEVSRV